MGALAVVSQAIAKRSPARSTAAASCLVSSRKTFSPSNRRARTRSVFSQPPVASTTAMTMTKAAWKSTAKAGVTLAQRLMRASTVHTSRFEDFAPAGVLVWGRKVCSEGVCADANL